MLARPIGRYSYRRRNIGVTYRHRVWRRSVFGCDRYVGALAMSDISLGEAQCTSVTPAISSHTARVDHFPLSPRPPKGPEGR